MQLTNIFFSAILTKTISFFVFALDGISDGGYFHYVGHRRH
jgi:hypothetical protein